jgi:glucosamine 6-phosphate synthetase-like amidotransferase/phosphosugar isomerase protein
MSQSRPIARDRVQALMCGIFGFALMKPMAVSKALRVLQKLEVHQYPHELRPLGGYGAGLAVLQGKGIVTLEKLGKTPGDVSPAKRLSRIVTVDKARVLVGHVRMPLPEFRGTAKFKETAQPYMIRREPNLTVVSVHNGKVENYKQLRSELSQEHVFESENLGLIDSEIIPHIFERLLEEKRGPDEALYSLFCTLHGPSAIGMLQINEDEAFLHFVHKGKTRGLTIWTNSRGELIFCSRKEPLIEELGGTLAKERFREKVSIEWQEDVGLKLSHRLVLE